MPRTDVLSIPPERLLRAGLLMALDSIRGERALCKEITFNLLYQWFLGMDMIEPEFDQSTFTKNRERLLGHRVVDAVVAAVVRQADTRKLLSEEHFTVDGTLIEAAASYKRFRPKAEIDTDEPPDDPGNPTVDYRRTKRSDRTHASTTDPEDRFAKKRASEEAGLRYAAHALMEHRNGLVVDLQITTAAGTAERDAVPVLLDRAGASPATV